MSKIPFHYTQYNNLKKNYMCFQVKTYGNPIIPEHATIRLNTYLAGETEQMNLEKSQKKQSKKNTVNTYM